RVPEPARVPALSPARARRRRAAPVLADRRGAGHAGRRRVARRAGCEDGLLERLQVARRLVGGAAPVLTPSRRVVIGAVLGVLVGSYYAWSSSLWNASTWWDVAWVSLVLVPAVFAFVYLALPLRTWNGALPLGLALVLATWGLEEAGQDAVANFSKLAAATLLGFWFIRLFETVGLVVFVACLIPWIDAYSVWRGP